MPSSADRIAAAAASLGVSKIDYLLLTHYHVDHLGGLESLLAKLPVGTFIDHGPNREEPPPNATPRQLAFATATFYPKWVAAYQGHKHIIAQAGQKLDIGSMHLEFVTSDGQVLDKLLPGAGQPNPLCTGVPGMDRDGGEENVRSVGTLITFGKTRILYLGDLTWNKEMELLCPANKVGKVDVYFVTGHGMNLSSSPPTSGSAGSASRAIRVSRIASAESSARASSRQSEPKTGSRASGRSGEPTGELDRGSVFTVTFPRKKTA